MKTELIIELANRNGGVVTSSMVDRANIDRSLLRHLHRSGRLERVQRGVYFLPDAWDDEPYTIQYRFSRGIFSHNTALWLHDLSDQTPVKFDLTFPRGYNTSSARQEGIIARTVSRDLHELGVENVITPGGHKVLTYCAERSICDVLRARSRSDVRTGVDALKAYVVSSRRDVPRLEEYATKLGVERRLSAYLEVVL